MTNGKLAEALKSEAMAARRPAEKKPRAQVRPRPSAEMRRPELTLLVSALRMLRSIARLLRKGRRTLSVLSSRR